jgi:hypothetical protein
MKFRYLPFLFMIVFLIVISINPGRAHGQDTGDGFKPQPMCSTPEPQPTDSKPWPDLQQGHYGLLVEKLQQKLGIRADGCFGPGTDKTVERYQTCKGLVIDGIAGKQTWSALQRDSSMASCKAPATQTSSAGLPDHCNIGLTCVIVTRSSSKIQIFYSESGELVTEGPMLYNSNKLVKGEYKVKEKKQINYDEKKSEEDEFNWQLNKFIRFSGHFGFHEIPISLKTGERMHGENLLGTGAVQTGGCIRGGVKLLSVLWNYTVVGTPVVVV